MYVFLLGLLVTVCSLPTSTEGRRALEGLPFPISFIGTSPYFLFVYLLLFIFSLWLCLGLEQYSPLFGAVGPFACVYVAPLVNVLLFLFCYE